jgi:hypothetical protein
MANTYILIEGKTLASAQANVEFTGLGSYSTTYTDLKLSISTRSVSDSGASVLGITLQFNGDTTSGNYTWKRLYGAGSGSGASDSNGNIILSNSDSSTASTFGSADIYVPSAYSGYVKSFSADGVSENNATTAYAILGNGVWASTASLTSIKLIPSSGNFAINSTFYLYGIKNS